MAAHGHAVDAFIPEPIRDVEKPFLMSIPRTS